MYCLHGSHIDFLNSKEFQEDKHITGEDSFELTSTFLLVLVIVYSDWGNNRTDETGLLYSLEERYGRRVDI